MAPSSDPTDPEILAVIERCGLGWIRCMYIYICEPWASLVSLFLTGATHTSTPKIIYIYIHAKQTIVDSIRSAAHGAGKVAGIFCGNGDTAKYARAFFQLFFFPSLFGPSCTFLFVTKTTPNPSPIPLPNFPHQHKNHINHLNYKYHRGMVARGFDFVCPGWDLGYLTSAAGKELATARGGADGGALLVRSKLIYLCSVCG